MISDRPFWLDTVAEEQFRLPGGRALPEMPRRAAVAIIGGGIVGLACAYYLTAAGERGVLLLERDSLMHAASAANAGGLWHTQQAPGAGVFHALGRASQALLAGFAAGLEEDLEYRRPGVLVVARSPEEAEAVRAGAEARRAGGLAVEWLEAREAARREPALAADQVHGAAWHPEDCHVNPAKLGAAFAREARRGGAVLVTGAAVRAIEPGSGGTRVHTDRGTVEAGRLVVTTGAWAAELGAALGLELPVAPAKGQMVAAGPLPPLLSRPVLGPYGILQTAGGHVLSGGTVELVGFDAEPRAATRDAIWEAAAGLVPALRGVPLTHSWARFRPHTPDGLPLIGFCDPERRHLVATGHFRNGLLLSAVTGRIVADLIGRGETSLPLAALDPRRFTPSA